MSHSEFFPDFIVRHARNQPERPAAVFARHGLPDERLTYAELDTAARRVAVRLTGLGVLPGSRVLLLLPTGLDFVKAFLGCMYAGAVPVPAPQPGGQRHHLARTAGIARDAGVTAVLTDGADLDEITAWLREDGLDGVVCETVATTEAAGDAAAWSRPVHTDGDAGGEAGGEALAFLQYTSGSTSEPKGVMVSHRNLLHNIDLIRTRLRIDSSDSVCSWLPMYHDMGLIGLLLMPLRLGLTTTLMSAVDFLKRPFMWLEVVARQQVTITSAPSFAYDLCARRLTDEQVAGLDLSRWRVACNGAEPIDPAVLDRFAKRFAPSGFRSEFFLPCYGMAETTLFISGREPQDEPLVLSVDAAALERDALVPVAPDRPGSPLVSCGTVSDLEARIVDPKTAEALPDGLVGEIWVRGGSVARGYWAKEEQTRETFRARIAGSSEEDGAGFLRTGDLGAFLDGELYVTGRLKEMMIVNGRNLYPQDIERDVRTVHPSLASLATAVFSVPAPQEQLVIVQEVRPAGLDGVTPAELAASIRSLIGERLGARVSNVVLVRPGRVEKTTSGKIRRGLMRERFMRSGIEVLHEVLDPAVRDAFRAAALPDGAVA
ncbi:fatty acyl-AMP ligase [Streptomyces sp. NPDC054932]